MRLVVDRDECLSSGRCVADAPQAFAFDDDDLAVVLPGAAALADAELMRLARACPSGAIRLEDAEGGPISVG